MTANNDGDLKFINFVQSACARPKMYTENGTLAEVYAMLIGFQLGSAHRKDADRFAVCETLQWMWNSVSDRTKTISEFVARYGSDAAALNAIDTFAATLPPS